MFSIFGTKDESYSAEIGQGTDNVGVIAARIFREKPRASFSVDPGWSYPKPTKHKKSFRPASDSSLYSASIRSLGSMQCSTSRSRMADIRDAPRGIVESASNSISSNTATTSLGTSLGVEQEVKTGGGIITPTPDVFDIEEQSLGTVFGEAVEWKTEKVQFVKASKLPDASLVVYYDTRKNLEKRGIKFRKEAAPLPNPFPGNKDGCPTPPNWKG
jgi:hypothetical protein